MMMMKYDLLKADHQQFYPLGQGFNHIFLSTKQQYVTLISFTIHRALSHLSQRSE
jgi:hypothetical protein